MFVWIDVFVRYLHVHQQYILDSCFQLNTDKDLGKRMHLKMVHFFKILLVLALWY